MGKDKNSGTPVTVADQIQLLREKGGYSELLGLDKFIDLLNGHLDTLGPDKKRQFIKQFLGLDATKISRDVLLDKLSVLRARIESWLGRYEPSDELDADTAYLCRLILAHEGARYVFYVTREGMDACSVEIYNKLASYRRMAPYMPSEKILVKGLRSVLRQYKGHGVETTSTILDNSILPYNIYCQFHMARVARRIDGRVKEVLLNLLPAIPDGKYGQKNTQANSCFEMAAIELADYEGRDNMFPPLQRLSRNH